MINYRNILKNCAAKLFMLVIMLAANQMLIYCEVNW